MRPCAFRRRQSGGNVRWLGGRTLSAGIFDVDGGGRSGDARLRIVALRQYSLVILFFMRPSEQRCARDGPESSDVLAAAAGAISTSMVAGAAAAGAISIVDGGGCAAGAISMSAMVLLSVWVLSVKATLICEGRALSSSPGLKPRGTGDNTWCGWSAMKVSQATHSVPSALLSPPPAERPVYTVMDPRQAYAYRMIRFAELQKSVEVAALLEEDAATRYAPRAPPPQRMVTPPVTTRNSSPPHPKRSSPEDSAPTPRHARRQRRFTTGDLEDWMLANNVTRETMFEATRPAGGGSGRAGGAGHADRSGVGGDLANRAGRSNRAAAPAGRRRAFAPSGAPILCELRL